ncbi:MAG: glycosyl transferase family 1, partial [Vicinamibacterales bacterium]
MKLAFVVQRYGDTIAGGSEAHCRLLAEHLAARHDITVLTTCATDYVSWANDSPAGETVERGVRVIRFPVARPRALKRFADLSDLVFAGHASREDETAWFRENGPDCPALLDHLRARGQSWDLVLFWTFRYAPSYFGLPLVAERAVLVPTAEEDAASELAVLEDFFSLPAGYLFLTPEEKTLVTSRAGRPPAQSEIIGMGLDPVRPSLS